MYVEKKKKKIEWIPSKKVVNNKLANPIDYIPVLLTFGLIDHTARSVTLPNQQLTTFSTGCCKKTNNPNNSICS